MSERKGPGLEFVSLGLLPLGPGQHHWIDIKQFALHSRPSGPAVLDELIGHVRYRDTYITDDSHEVDSGNVHGPYRLEEITPAAFEPIDATSAAELVTSYARRFELPEERWSELDRSVLDPIAAASSIHRLKDLGNGAWYDCGGILDDFEELVAIDTARSTLALVVLGGD